MVKKNILQTRWFGWRPDLPDHRDLKMSMARGESQILPEVVDLRTHPAAPPIVDQGPLGSCTANGILSLYQFVLAKFGQKYAFIASRLFLYYNERAMEGTINEDAGAYIRDGFKSLSHEGACHESECKYNISMFAKRPNKRCYTNGLKHQVLEYRRINQDENAMRRVIAGGLPFVFGFSVYDSFESAPLGVMPLPSPTEQLLGGHCVMAVGYNQQSVICQNSWGKDWGDHGYFYMPWDYIVNPDLADDFWTLSNVELVKQ